MRGRAELRHAGTALHGSAFVANHDAALIGKAPHRNGRWR